VKPTIAGVSKLYPTSISPQPAVIGAYLLAVYVCQVGFCVLLVFARKQETKNTLVKGVGMTLVLSNWVLAFWAIAWVLKLFLVATIFQGIILLLLIYANVVLLIYHKPASSRPLDTALIHAPMRFFLILPLSVLFPISLFITLNLSYVPGTPEYNMHALPGFLVTLGTNLVGLAIVIFHRDIVWCIAATWVCVGIWTAAGGLRPGSIMITAIVFTVLHPLALMTALIWHAFFRRESRERRKGPIALPPDEEDAVPVNEDAFGDGHHPEGDAHGHGHGHGHQADAPKPQAARELDPEALWG